MQVGIHALHWTVQRLGIGLAILVGLILLAYLAVIAFVVIGEAVAGLG